MTKFMSCSCSGGFAPRRRGLEGSCRQVGRRRGLGGPGHAAAPARVLLAGHRRLAGATEARVVSIQHVMPSRARYRDGRVLSRGGLFGRRGETVREDLRRWGGGCSARVRFAGAVKSLVRPAYSSLAELAAEVERLQTAGVSFRSEIIQDVGGPQLPTPAAVRSTR